MSEYNPTPEQRERDLAFDLWLAARDREVAARALVDFAIKWGQWIMTDAPQVRGGASYRAYAEAEAILKGDTA